MNDPIVSVIIPVYKAEHFLDECLNSVIDQDYPALEIILVDDGSPDSCPEKCDRYAEAYGNIVVIHQANRGPGAARNAGLEVAFGKYVIFVDADDRLDGAEAIGRMVELAEEKYADIVVGAFRRLDGRQVSAPCRFRFQDGAYTETVDFRFKGFVSHTHLITPWCKLYRRAFLTENALRFPDYSFSEDKSFNLMCCACRPVYASLDESVYLYRVNGDSISFQYHDDFIPVWTAVVFDFQQFLCERGLAEEYGDLVAFDFCMGLCLLAFQELKHGGVSKTAKALSEYGRNPLVRRMVRKLACGRYVGQIESKAWGILVWGASLLCCLRAYRLLALGMWVLQKGETAERLRRPSYES